jgi:hypothetical protein
MDTESQFSNQGPFPFNSSKNRFCKKCGSIVDPKTKKCMGCGKQYFKLPLASNFIFLAILMLIAYAVYAGWLSDLIDTIAPMCALIAFVLYPILYSCFLYNGILETGKKPPSIIKKISVIICLVGILIISGYGVVFISNSIYESGYQQGYDAVTAEQTNIVGSINRVAEKYVASISGKKYHVATCTYANNIKEDNLIYFDSKEDAEKNGYSPCSVCNP